MDFPMDFWLFWMCFVNVLFNLYLQRMFYQRRPSEAFLYHRIVSCVHSPHVGWREAGNMEAFSENISKKLTKKRATKGKKVNQAPPPPQEIHRLGPLDSKIYTHNCDSTAVKVSRLSPKLSLWIPSLEKGFAAFVCLFERQECMVPIMEPEQQRRLSF